MCLITNNPKKKFMLSNKKIIITFLFIVLTGKIIFSQSLSSSTSYNTAELTAKTSKTFFADLKKNFSDGLTRTATDQKVGITINLGDQYLFGKNTFSTSVTLTLTAIQVVSATKSNTLTTKDITFSLSQSTPEIYYELSNTDLNTWIGSANITKLNQFKVSVKSYTASTVVSSYLAISLSHTVSYTLNVNNISLNPTTVTSSANPQTFQWTATASGKTVTDVPYWQFQLLRLYNIDESSLNDSSIIAELDWNKALCLWIKNTSNTSATASLKLNIAEGEGYYAWRVRPIGSQYGSSSITDNRNAGSWSTTDGDISITLDASGDPSYTFYYTDKDKNYNTIYTRSFSEADDNNSIKITETKSYANGLNMLLETQAINQSNGFVVASQNIFDYVGNAALTSLPVPLTTMNTFSYIKNLMPDAAKGVYTADDFNDASHYNSPATIDSSGYFAYYSDNNSTSNYVASSQGYPYIISHYKNDGSKRIIETSSPGKSLSIGKGHTTTYSYPSASIPESELSYIFNDETPKEATFHKTKTTDANGVCTNMYYNQNDQVIATCLEAKTSANSALDKANTHSSNTDGFKHHYTLFYYDRAGNLVKTISPKGVGTPKTGYVADKTVHTNYAFETEYDYNFMGQLSRKKTPDGGETYFYYDNLKRLRFSQNAKQKVNKTYSYIKYDALNRVVESGESSENATTLSSFIDDNSLPSSGTDRAFTIYNTAASVTCSGQSQTYLRNRISYVYNDDGVYTYYSYDAHGNVKWLIQNIPNLGSKILAYEYDVVSNQVTKVKYNEGCIDEFYTRYTYDADNRITKLETSSDNKRWEADASYEFYKHGPLKRSNIGKDQLQGLDYLYTLQGWLKGINHNSLDKTIDPGSDNNTNNYAPDAFGCMLSYYSGDYYRKSSSFNANTSNKYNLSNTTASLYNGSIIACSDKSLNSTLTSSSLSYTDISGYIYKYDELYELTQGNYYGFGSSTGKWTATNNYKMEIAYDANGNISSLTRNGYLNATKGAKTDMDNLTYNYTANTNQLSYIKDAVSNSNYAVDLDDQTAYSSAGNYLYDEIGQLKTDQAEGITSIEWNGLNKIKKVSKKDGTTIKITYDAMGNRIKKETSGSATATNNKITYYVNDASGKTISIYEETATTSGTKTTKTIKQVELPILATSRIGEYKPDATVRQIVSSSTTTTITDYSKTKNGAYLRNMGKKAYEINDYLGNVRVGFTDIKTSSLDSKTKKPGIFSLDLTSVSNYYPYGMAMVGNTYSTDNYRYGIQGKEKDNDIKGSGNSYNFGARILDPRVGRWLSTDPISDKYPSLSPYNYCANNPIMFVDPDGKQEKPALTLEDYATPFLDLVELYNPADGTMRSLVEADRSVEKTMKAVASDVIHAAIEGTELPVAELVMPAEKTAEIITHFNDQGKVMRDAVESMRRHGAGEDTWVAGKGWVPVIKIPKSTRKPYDACSNGSVVCIENENLSFIPSLISPKNGYKTIQKSAKSSINNFQPINVNSANIPLEKGAYTEDLHKDPNTSYNANHEINKQRQDKNNNPGNLDDKK